MQNQTCNDFFARFQKVFCGVLKCIVTFLWNQMKFQKQFVPCWHLSLTSSHLLGIGWHIQPICFHAEYVLFLQTCQNESGLSWPIIFCWPVFCSRNLKWLRDLFTNFEQFLAQINAISVHIPFTNVRACEFQSLWPHSPGSGSRGTCTLGSRPTTGSSVDISNCCLNEGWDLVKMESCVVSMSLHFIFKPK